MGKARTVAKKATNGGPPVDLHDVEALVSVVESGSFTKAATRSGLPKSALSRRVARLEQSLHVRLLQRTTRSLSLTEAGAEYHRRAAEALTQLREARDVALETTQEPQGTIRITAPVDVGTGFLTPVLVAFTKRYPKVNVEVDLTPRYVDLVAEGFDLAVRAGKLRDSSLVARLLGRSHLVLVASPEYLERRGRPSSVAELAQHDCILFRPVNGANTWALSGPHGEEKVVVRGPLAGSDFPFVRNAALLGAGIALMPLGACFDDLRSGELVGILHEHQGIEGAIHLVYPSASYLPLRVAMLRDFLLEHLKVPSREDVAKLCRSCPSAGDPGHQSKVGPKRQKTSGRHVREGAPGVK